MLLPEMEFLLNVIHHFGSSRSRQRQDRYAGQHFADIGYRHIRGTEIIAPLRDAMAFVHGQEADLHRLQLSLEYFRRKALGRDIEELVIPEDTILQLHKYLLASHAGMHCRSFDTELAEIIYLVFHQGDKRSNDYANPRHRQRRDLEGDRLPSACRHQSQRIFSGTDGADDVLLQRTE